MLARIHRVPILAAAMALGLTTAAAGSAAATTSPPVSGASASPAHLAAAPQISLPTGDRLLVTGSGPTATVMVLSYGTVGAQAAATAATVSASFDKGATWTAASTIPVGQNHFVALWKNTAAKGATPWLKVTASDALGGSITQTAANAYTIG